MKRKRTEGYKAKFGYRCMNCGKPGNIAHHIVPLSKGGIDHPDNWIILCQKCQTKEKVHRNADIMELPLATKKHYFESGLEIAKIPETFINVPHITINLIHPHPCNLPKKPVETKIEASTRTTKEKSVIKMEIPRICPNCENIFTGRDNKLFCSNICRWNHHNKIKKLKQKEIEQLAKGYFVLLSL